MEHNGSEKRHGFFSSRANIVFLGFLVIGGYFLVTEHRAHLYLAAPYLPWLLLLACPLMHVFMHHGHGGHGGGDDESAGPGAPPHSH